MFDKAQAVPDLPKPWNTFLREVDGLLSRPAHLHLLGGFVLTTVYGLSRPTTDIECISVIPHEALDQILQIAGRDSPLARKHKVYLDFASVADCPEDYAERITEIFPNRFSKLRLFASEAQDLVLAKLTRNHPVDFEDVKFLAAARRLDPRTLEERYYRELQPHLTNGGRYDLTLKLWLEACFPS
jgi:hypothetical protein